MWDAGNRDSALRWNEVIPSLQHPASCTLLTWFLLRQLSSRGLLCRLFRRLLGNLGRFLGGSRWLGWRLFRLFFFRCFCWLLLYFRGFFLGLGRRGRSLRGHWLCHWLWRLRFRLCRTL